MNCFIDCEPNLSLPNLKSYILTAPVELTQVEHTTLLVNKQSIMFRDEQLSLYLDRSFSDDEVSRLEDVAACPHDHHLEAEKKIIFKANYKMI